MALGAPVVLRLLGGAAAAAAPLDGPHVVHVEPDPDADVAGCGDTSSLTFDAVAADQDQFLTIAKFRALRKLWARIEEAWREYLAERWEIPPGTPTTRWGDLLEAQGADPDASRELVRLADDLHYLRYAPQLSTCGTLCGEVLDRCRKILRRL